jgi:hypothetical protein
MGDRRPGAGTDHDRGLVVVGRDRIRREDSGPHQAGDRVLDRADQGPPGRIPAVRVAGEPGRRAGQVAGECEGRDPLPGSVATWAAGRRGGVELVGQAPAGGAVRTSGEVEVVPERQGRRVSRRAGGRAGPAGETPRRAPRGARAPRPGSCSRRGRRPGGRRPRCRGPPRARSGDPRPAGGRGPGWRRGRSVLFVPATGGTPRGEGRRPPLGPS